MFNLFKFRKQLDRLVSPISGECCNLSEGKDPVFAEGLMGPGCFIVPDGNGEIYSPCDGIVQTVFPTKHAYGLTTTNGVEVIIHIGVDTVNLNGEFFDCKIQRKQKIKKGELLAEFDYQALINRAIIPDVFLVLPNQKKENFEIKYGKVEAGDILFIMSS